jgi:hypothetical protein
MTGGDSSAMLGMTKPKQHMTTIKKIFVVLAMMGFIIPSFVFAQYGLRGASQDTGLIKGGQSIDAQKTVPELIGTIVGVVLSFVGAIFFLLILYAGFLWMTAFGSSEKADKAKSILEHAAIGLVIVLAAYAISRFVFSGLAGGGSSSVNTSASTACETSFPGSACIQRSVCQELIGIGSGGGTSFRIVTGLCPGGVDNICCVRD